MYFHCVRHTYRQPVLHLPLPLAARLSWYCGGATVSLRARWVVDGGRCPSPLAFKPSLRRRAWASVLSTRCPGHEPPAVAAGSVAYTDHGAQRDSGTTSAPIGGGAPDRCVAGEPTVRLEDGKANGFPPVWWVFTILLYRCISIDLYILLSMTVLCALYTTQIML